ncbi:ribosome hibernation-promoting factor, HPF/YfiA family [Thermogemmatispora carboxidivorans]|uniref:ribosome hibernation-promoting factor, HPF/YfiA family n=1 Tax=Thermogemmatispora carboxidivorans TaxID=1382306 RepID=UPI00069B6D09|nr:ribosome-associated translation inhibitor RaiA [Thermogemmatispora carboxidivorans]
MQIIIKGKQMEVMPRLRQHIERKAHKLTRLISPRNSTARLEITIAEEHARSAQDRYTVQILLMGVVPTLRSEVSAPKATVAFDQAFGKLLAQFCRQKDRLTAARRHQRLPVKVLALARSGQLSVLEGKEGAVVTAEREEAEVTEDLPVPTSLSEEQNETVWARIKEIRSLPTKPMSDREAILQMEALGLPFYPFVNEATNSVNVMYRLEKGGYGLLIPALE